MCTTGKEQSSSKETKNALCVFPEIQRPLKVEVLAKAYREGELLRVKLCTEEAIALKVKYGDFIKSHRFEIAVPQKCLVPPVSFLNANPEEIQQPTSQIFNSYYYPCSLENVSVLDIVAWVRPLTLGHVEFIPCTLHGSGFDVAVPSGGYAYVCPLNHSSKNALTYKMYAASYVVPGPGCEKVFKVPISDIFRWEDINRTRLQVQTELEFDEIVPVPGKREWETTYTFVYKERATKKEPNSTEENMDIVRDAHSNLEKKMDNVRKIPKSLDDGGAFGGSKGNYLTTRRGTTAPCEYISPQKIDNVTQPIATAPKGASSLEREAFGETRGKHLTRERIRESDYYLQEKKECLIELKSNKWTGYPNNLIQKSSDVSREDDGFHTAGGSGAKAINHFSTDDDYPELHKVTTTSLASTSRETKRKTKKHDNNDSSKIDLFCNCFTMDGFETVTSREIECGDGIVATPNDHDDIIGKVELIGKIPSIHKDLVLVGVSFEEKINVVPFEVRHAWADENTYHDFHACGNMTLIPLNVLLEHQKYGPSERKFCILKSAATVPTSNIHVDFQFEASRCEPIQTEPLDIDTLSHKKLKCIGIQGNANSCYLDSVLFALYGVTSNFDEGLYKQQSYNEPKDDLRMKQEAARNLLKYDIVTPLRSAIKVNWVSVYKLRVIMAEIMDDKSYLANFMDAEQFITNLFGNVLQVPEFFEIGEDTKDYVLQLFPAMPTEGQQVTRPSVQYLLQEYCNSLDIKLRGVPQNGFLIKLPVCGGIPLYKLVIPNLELNLDPLLEMKGQSSSILVLRAVICLNNAHFTCFVRTFSNTEITWFFHDSMAHTLEDSNLTKCEGLEEKLHEAASIFDDPFWPADPSSLDARAKQWIDRLLTTAYICVYEPAYRSTVV